VADETGDVQYATQTVTVTERDAKALGQPVGSTTTVLLTAYPGGHSGGLDSATDTSQQFLSPPSTSTNVPNVQVVYSASHIDTIPDTLVSSISSSVPQTYSSASATTVASMPSLDPTAMVMAQGGGAAIQDSTAEYLNPAAGQDVMVGGNIAAAADPRTGAEANPTDTDIAAQLISEYVASGQSVPGFQPPDGTAADSESMQTEALAPPTTTTTTVST